MLRHSSALRRSLRNFYVRYGRYAVALAILLLLETTYHVRSFRVPRPAAELDAPFYRGCQQPNVDGPRANATILMLARNSDAVDAGRSIQSLEDQFNKWFHYPITFLNDHEWDQEFKDRLTRIASGPVSFEVIDDKMWGFPEWIDQAAAKQKMGRMKSNGIRYAGIESYHHMCRFNSGMFYDHPALKKYKWYWRVEPDVRFTCSIPYDPFIEMEKNKKSYGYTVALWELGETVPTLFRKISEYKKKHRIKTTPLWTAMMDPSYLPWPLRPLLSLLRNRDEHGDLWNMCHFWSNFEIADMDFFRSEGYRKLFDYLDAEGGFYYERWGDAPVHSLAAALLLEPREVHHFADIGYIHGDYQFCSWAYSDGTFGTVDQMNEEHWQSKPEMAIGCNCTCEPDVKVLGPVCLNKIRSTVL